jgi:hypothetical protein
MIDQNHDHPITEENIGESQRIDQKEINMIHEKVWHSISKNYDMIQGAQLSNSFIILIALSESKRPLTTTQVSEIISRKSKGQIYKNPATLKDSLEYRLKRDGYVKGVTQANKILYSITPKGKTLLNGWIAFIKAID